MYGTRPESQSNRKDRVVFLKQLFIYFSKREDVKGQGQCSWVTWDSEFRSPNFWKELYKLNYPKIPESLAKEHSRQVKKSISNVIPVIELLWTLTSNLSNKNDPTQRAESRLQCLRIFQDTLRHWRRDQPQSRYSEKTLTVEKVKL